MAVREIRTNIFSVGAIDWDRRLFDELIPLPHGTSYNSYLIRGSEKVALVDTVFPPKQSELIKNLKRLDINKLDYIIANHGEQDHSGSIPKLLELFPDAKIVTNSKCKALIIDALLVSEDKFIEIKDRETLSLGDKTLEFIFTPWVHWPDTMVTYLKEDKILFTCDFFGSHLATSDLFVKDESDVYEPAKRYYAEIMMPFRMHIKKHLEKIKDLDIDLIAPSHGPIYSNPEFIINCYKDWISDEVKNEVVIPFASMYENTAQMVNYLADRLMESGVTVRLFNVVKSDIGELAVALVDASTIVLASPTVLAGAHPAVAYAAFIANALRPKAKYASIIGSYGWAGNMAEQLKGLIPNLKVELFDPVIIKGLPKEDDFKALDKLAGEIADRNNAKLLSVR